MSDYTHIRRNVVLEYLEEYIGYPSRAIARMIVKNNPLLFKDIEDARNVIRKYRGQHGNRNRKVIKLTKFYTYE